MSGGGGRARGGGGGGGGVAAVAGPRWRRPAIRGRADDERK